MTEETTTSFIEKMTRQHREAEAAIKDHANDGEYDKDRAIKDLTESLEVTLKLVKENNEKIELLEKARKAQIEYEYLGGVGSDAQEKLKNNRYKYVVRDIREKGYYKDGSDTYTAADFGLSCQTLIANNAFMRMKGHSAPQASQDLIDAFKVISQKTFRQKFLRPDIAGEGQEWIVQETARFIWEEFFQATVIMSLLSSRGRIIDLPSDPFPVPEQFGDFVWHKFSPGQGTTPQTPVTAKTLLTQTPQMTSVSWDYTMDEDAVVAQMPHLRKNLTQSASRDMEKFFINADGNAGAAGNINSDDLAPPTNSYYLSDGQDGLRAVPLISNPGNQIVEGGNAALTKDLIVSAMVKQDKYLDDSVMLINTPTLPSLLAIAEIVALSPAQVGNSPILTGQVSQFLGVPILTISKDSMPLTEADGKISAVTPTNNTQGSVIVFAPNRWLTGFKRALLIEVDKNIQTQVNIMVASFRQAQAAWGDRDTLNDSTTRHVTLIRDLAV